MLPRRTVLFGVVASFVLGACAQTASVPEATYYLVRHAEKTAEKPDPALTEAGQARAQALVSRLEGVKLTAIYSSNYIRTRNTAAPSAEAQGLDVQLYNPRELQDFAAQLKQENGHILVVGHSNTTPELSAFIGGPKGDPIAEDTEYDRLYILERTGDQVTGRIERYGD